jgi:hypothetical protein
MEKAHQDVLFEKILSVSLTSHFWNFSNSLMSTLTLEPESLVSWLIDQHLYHIVNKHANYSDLSTHIKFLLLLRKISELSHHRGFVLMKLH